MSTNGSQKLDIADICEAVVGSIRDDVTNIASAAASEVLTKSELASLDVQRDLARSVREIVLHLRVITGEDFSNDH